MDKLRSILAHLGLVWQTPANRLLFLMSPGLLRPDAKKSRTEADTIALKGFGESLQFRGETGTFADSLEALIPHHGAARDYPCTVSARTGEPRILCDDEHFPPCALEAAQVCLATWCLSNKWTESFDSPFDVASFTVLVCSFLTHSSICAKNDARPHRPTEGGRLTYGQLDGPRIVRSLP